MWNRRIFTARIECYRLMTMCPWFVGCPATYLERVWEGLDWDLVSCKGWEGKREWELLGRFEVRTMQMQFPKIPIEEPQFETLDERHDFSEHSIFHLGEQRQRQRQQQQQSWGEWRCFHFNQILDIGFWILDIGYCNICLQLTSELFSIDTWCTT